MNTIIPSVGRIVHVFSKSFHNQGGEVAGIVAKVHFNDCIDVTVFPPGGTPLPLTSVQFADELGEQHMCWHWMEYQVQQAAKHAE